MYCLKKAQICVIAQINYNRFKQLFDHIISNFSAIAIGSIAIGMKMNENENFYITLFFTYLNYFATSQIHVCA